MTSVRSIWTSLALTVLLTGASMAAAQPQEARQNPHTQVSSDGVLPARAEASLDYAESFDGIGPALATADARFDETGAILDGATEVNESAEDVWALFENAGTSSIKGIFGGSIIGADTRTRVNPTTGYPARAIALVTFNGTCFDVPLLETLWRSFVDELPPPAHVEFDEAGELAEVREAVDAGLAFVAEADGPVGFALARRTGSRLGRLTDLYVVPDARRGGIAAALVHAAVEALASQDV